MQKFEEKGPYYNEGFQYHQLIVSLYIYIYIYIYLSFNQCSMNEINGTSNLIASSLLFLLCGKLKKIQYKRNYSLTDKE